MSENYLGDLLTTVLTLIEQDLQTHPQEEWPLILKNFHLDTDFDLDIDEKLDGKPSPSIRLSKLGFK